MCHAEPVEGNASFSPGIIAKHTALRDWYRGLGFTKSETKGFPHIFFEVLFLEMKIDGVADKSVQPAAVRFAACGADLKRDIN